ncbi:hypothetical protein BH24BAC1_BH24BAC1_10210 [soil metagenome]
MPTKLTVKVPEIIEILAVTSSHLSAANLRNFSFLVEAILATSTPVTTLSVSRICRASHRTLQRFYALDNIDWLLVRLLLLRAFIYQPEHHYLLAGDETVEDKAGKHTYGMGRFYSSLSQRAINSVSFLALSLIDVQTRKSSLVACEQLIKNKADALAPKTEKKQQSQEPKRGRGRPKGSKNKPEQQPQSLSYQTMKVLLSLFKSRLKAVLPSLNCFHLVLDGFYGHCAYLQLALEHELKIISRFKSNACLYLPYQGEYKGKGRPQTKGHKVNLEQLPASCFVSSIEDEKQKVRTHIYAFSAYTPAMAGGLLKVVVLVHTHRVTGRSSRTILFTNDLELTAEQVKDYYSLRFQIEFDFRDAKQYFGLSSFRNYKQTQVTNAANIAFTMTLVSKILLEKMRERYNCETMGITDMKVLYRIGRWVEEYLKFNKSNQNEFLTPQQFIDIARLEAIHL